MPNRRLLEARTSRLGVLVATALASVVALGVACDDKKSASTATPQTNPINQGNQANQSSSQIEGWQDATAPANLDATQACALFQRALCERKNECGIATEDCTKAMANCPDTLFAPGSTREPKSTWDCAFVIRGYACEELYLRRNPACVSGGSRKLGEACMSPAQCASLACDGSASACGKCLPRLGKNQSCLSAEGRPTAACEPGLTCNTETKTCVDAPAKSFAEVDGAGLGVGAECVPARDACADGLYCLDEGTGEGKCTPRIAEDQPCTTSMACVEGTYCYQEGSSCLKLPELGKRCGNDVETGNAFHCTKDAYCDVETHLCTELPGAGEPCAATLLSGGFNVCAPSAICDGSSNPPVCKALGTPGDRCSGDEECQTHLRCQCGKPNDNSPSDADAGAPLDGSVLEGSDAADALDVDWQPKGRDGQTDSETGACTKVCTLSQSAGKSCVNPGESCDAASTCKEGTCQSNPSQKLHQSLCGN
ncbi:MAG TPA: hypothetical protein VKP30_33510 [Polyangiaceae bacterium]|nr:hypothetical protein [Polyangiaceae bacterium]